MATLGIDFGTSNSACGVLVNGRPHLIEIEPGEKTLPTSVFFDFDSRRTLFGNAANRALIDGVEGRFMRALKRVLGTSLMHEKRLILNERLDFVDIVARFLARLKAGAETACHTRFDHALSGRPVHFHTSDPARDAQALEDLRACYLRAGFESVDFLFEPEAAAIANGALDGDAPGLIVDIGGGTSDFTLFRSSGDGIDVLASHGVRLGGTNFDRALSLAHVMPLLGLGGALRNVFGDATLPAPVALFHDLATWEKIPFLYAPQTLRDVRAMARQAVAPEPFKRLLSILDLETGPPLAAGRIVPSRILKCGVRPQVTVGLWKPALQARDLTRDQCQVGVTDRGQLNPRPAHRVEVELGLEISIARKPNIDRPSHNRDTRIS